MHCCLPLRDPGRARPLSEPCVSCVQDVFTSAVLGMLVTLVLVLCLLGNRWTSPWPPFPEKGTEAQRGSWAISRSRTQCWCDRRDLNAGTWLEAHILHCVLQPYLHLIRVFLIPAPFTDRRSSRRPGDGARPLARPVAWVHDASRPLTPVSAPPSCLSDVCW